MRLSSCLLNKNWAAYPLAPLHCCYGNPVQAAFYWKTHSQMRNKPRMSPWLPSGKKSSIHLNHRWNLSKLYPLTYTYKYLDVFQPEFQYLNITNLMDDVSAGTSLVSSVIKPHHSKVFILSRAKRRRSKQCCLEVSTAKHCQRNMMMQMQR